MCMWHGDICTQNSHHSPCFFIPSLFAAISEHRAAKEGSSPIPSSQSFSPQAFLFLVALLSQNISGGTEGEDWDQGSGSWVRDVEKVLPTLFFICFGWWALCAPKGQRISLHATGNGV